MSRPLPVKSRRGPRRHRWVLKAPEQIGGVLLLLRLGGGRLRTQDRAAVTDGGRMSADKSELSLKLSLPIVPGVVTAEVPVQPARLKGLLGVFGRTAVDKLVQVVAARGMVN